MILGAILFEYSISKIYGVASVPRTAAVIDRPLVERTAADHDSKTIMTEGIWLEKKKNKELQHSDH